MTRTRTSARWVARAGAIASCVWISATPLEAQSGAPAWELRGRVEMRPLSIGECAFVSLFVRDPRGKLVMRPDGTLLGPADFELELSGPGATSFRWLRNTPDNYQMCATATAGPDGADIVITYPRRTLAPTQVFPGVAFSAVLPVVRGADGVVPDFLLLPIVPCALVPSARTAMQGGTAAPRENIGATSNPSGGSAMPRDTPGAPTRSAGASYPRDSTAGARDAGGTSAPREPRPATTAAAGVVNPRALPPDAGRGAALPRERATTGDGVSQMHAPPPCNTRPGGTGQAPRVSPEQPLERRNSPMLLLTTFRISA